MLAAKDPLVKGDIRPVSALIHGASGSLGSLTDGCSTVLHGCRPARVSTAEVTPHSSWKGIPGRLGTSVRCLATLSVAGSWPGLEGEALTGAGDREQRADVAGGQAVVEEASAAQDPPRRGTLVTELQRVRVT